MGSDRHHRVARTSRDLRTERHPLTAPGPARHTFRSERRPRAHRAQGRRSDLRLCGLARSGYPAIRSRSREQLAGTGVDETALVVDQA